MSSKSIGFVSFAVLAAVLCGCGVAGSGAPSGGDVPSALAALAPGDHVWTTSDGIPMPYTVAGSGPVTIVFVHCWMCDRTFWREQVDTFAREYRVVAMDLPGHGDAGTDRETWTVGRFGEDVAGLIADLDLREVVLVGHSMGGPVALRAAAIAEGRVRGIVAVDTLHDAEFVLPEERAAAMAEAFRSDFAGTCTRFVHAMFPEDGVEAIVDHVLERSCAPDRAPVGVALMLDFGTIDMPAWFREAGIPIRAINAAAPNPTRIEVNRKYADFDAELMDGVGHYPQLTRPDEFNGLLHAAIRDVLDAGR